MKAALTPYPAYRYSGIAWLGKVPEHWDVRRLKYISRFSYGDALPAEAREDGPVPVFGSNGQVGRHSAGNTEAPCIVIGRKGSFGKVNFSIEPVFAIDTTFFIDNRLTSQNIRWLVYQLGLLGLDDVSKDSAVPGLDREEAYQKVCPLPPLDEQTAIVKFLDYMDRRITRYVGAKKKLIKLLEEQKQAIIHRAVTSGLDPDVRFRPSGVLWLGDVPENWAVQKLKQLTRFRNGLAFKPSDWSAVGVPIIRIQNLNGSNDFNYTTRNDLPQVLRIQPGDLLFSWSGNRGTSFGSFIWDREFDGYLNQHIFKLDGFSLDRQYFAYLLRAVTRHVEEQTHGIIGLVHVTKPELGSVMVPIASPAEQVVIAKFIDDHIVSVNSTIYRTKQEIYLLNEYRTRLIADVVTGKLDVRAAAARLPDERIESELLDEANAPVVDDEFEGSDADLDAELEEVEA